MKILLYSLLESPFRIILVWTNYIWMFMVKVSWHMCWAREFRLYGNLKIYFLHKYHGHSWFAVFILQLLYFNNILPGISHVYTLTRFQDNGISHLQTLHILYWVNSSWAPLTQKAFPSLDLISSKPLHTVFNLLLISCLSVHTSFHTPPPGPNIKFLYLPTS